MIVTQVPRHKVFISYHVSDQEHKDHFARMMEYHFVDKSVKDEDIDDTYLKVETIRQKIRDDFIADATVTVVLIGPCTWQRKHVDWEIGSSLRDTKKNPRCGLLGILLPNHPSSGGKSYAPRLIPPRLADNCNGNPSYASIYNWSSETHTIRRWIHEAFQRRDGTPPDNSRDQYRNNLSGDCSRGWR